MRQIYPLIVLLIKQSLQYGTYKCSYVDTFRDQDILVTQDLMTESELDLCGHKFPQSCKCQMMQTLCSFGPDDKGHFILDQEVEEEMAETCPRDFCICTSHGDYHEILAFRIASATDQTSKPETLHQQRDESILEEEQDPVPEQ